MMACPIISSCACKSTVFNQILVNVFADNVIIIDSLTYCNEILYTVGFIISIISVYIT